MENLQIIADQVEHIMSTLRPQSFHQLRAARRGLAALHKQMRPLAEYADEERGLACTVLENILKAMEVIDEHMDKHTEGMAEFDASKVVVGEVLGNGPFAKCFKGTVCGHEVCVMKFSERFPDGDCLRDNYAVSSPWIVQTYGYDDSEDMVVKELMERSLDDAIKAGTLTPNEKVRIFVEIAKGLAWLHEHCGFVFRDVKPSNIMLKGDAVKFSDMVLAVKMVNGVAVDCSPAGSPLYMAPESFARGQITPASDIYSFGITMFYTLVGTIPHAEARGLRELAGIVSSGDISFLDGHPEITPALRDILTHCLAIDPAARPTASALVDELSRVLAEM